VLKVNEWLNATLSALLRKTKAETDQQSFGYFTNGSRIKHREIVVTFVSLENPTNVDERSNVGGKRKRPTERDKISFEESWKASGEERTKNGVAVEFDRG